MIVVELIKQARRARVWITLGLMGGVSTLLTTVIGLTRPSIPERIGNFGSVVTNTSGLTLPLIALSSLLLFFLPLGVALFAGEPVAGERAWGSLRYVLARPISRSRVLAAKAAVAGTFSVAAVGVVALSSTLTGVLAFGWRPLTVLDLQHTTPFHIAAATFSPLAAAGYIAVASAVVISTLASTFGFALFLSTFTSRPFSAVAGGVGLGLVSRALDNVPGLQPLSPWLPMTDKATTAWTGLFFRPADLAGLTHLLLVQALYTTAFLFGAWYLFTRADALA
jgi:ABC-2 type transport system permease protein